jgi:hypothetical protein
MIQGAHTKYTVLKPNGSKPIVIKPFGPTNVFKLRLIIINPKSCHNFPYSQQIISKPIATVVDSITFIQQFKPWMKYTKGGGVGEGPIYAAHRTVQPSHETFFSIYNSSRREEQRSCNGMGGGGAHSAQFFELLSPKIRVRKRSSWARAAKTKY